MQRKLLDAETAGRFARLALNCVDREFPNHPLTVMSSAEDVRRPREHTPAFFGCFDWHSAVHGHWTLVRLTRLFPDAAWAREARTALHKSLTTENLALELRFASKPGREGFERPYGLAWLLQLSIELQEWAECEMSAAIRPLEQHCRNRLAEWLPKLTHPIRSGEHSQTAFAMGLAFDWALGAGDQEFAELLRRRSLDFYEDDADLPLRYEPSGHDFLSPSLAEADLMRRVLPRERFTAWLRKALPDGFPLPPVTSADRADGKLAHLDGLNLSRAWMLDGLASALEHADPRQETFDRQAQEHAAAGLKTVTGDHYAGAHCAVRLQRIG